jgi:hypothetical protein
VLKVHPHAKGAKARVEELHKKLKLQGAWTRAGIKLEIGILGTSSR